MGECTPCLCGNHAACLLEDLPPFFQADIFYILATIYYYAQAFWLLLIPALIIRPLIKWRYPGLSSRLLNLYALLPVFLYFMIRAVIAALIGEGIVYVLPVLLIVILSALVCYILLISVDFLFSKLKRKHEKQS